MFGTGSSLRGGFSPLLLFPTSLSIAPSPFNNTTGQNCFSWLFISQKVGLCKAFLALLSVGGKKKPRGRGVHVTVILFCYGWFLQTERIGSESSPIRI